MKVSTELALCLGPIIFCANQPLVIENGRYKEKPMDADENDYDCGMRLYTSAHPTPMEASIVDPYMAIFEYISFSIATVFD